MYGEHSLCERPSWELKQVNNISTIANRDSSLVEFQLTRQHYCFANRGEHGHLLYGPPAGDDIELIQEICSL